MASEVPEEAQALLVLRRWQEMPRLGIQLVPEHVETRPLYHPRSPGLLQVREDSHLVLDLASLDALSLSTATSDSGSSSWFPASPFQTWSSIPDSITPPWILVLKDPYPLVTKSQTWHSQPVLYPRFLRSGPGEH